MFQGSTITMTKQIQYFSILQTSIMTYITTDRTYQLLSNSIFLISSGGNDIFAFFSKNSTPNRTEIDSLIATLASTYGYHIKVKFSFYCTWNYIFSQTNRYWWIFEFSKLLWQALYGLGARKFAIVDAPPIGCCPYTRSLHPAGACIDILNEMALGFNTALKSLMRSLSSQLQGMKYSIGSSYAVVWGIIRDPKALGKRDNLIRGWACT